MGKNITDLPKKPKNIIDIDDGYIATLRETDTEMTAIGLQHSAMRAKFVQQERRILHAMEALESDFKKTIKRIFKKKGLKSDNIRIKNIDYEKKQITIG